MLKRLTLAALAALLGMIVVFIATFFAVVLWYAQTDPHDGQLGLAGFYYGLITGPLAGLITFPAAFALLRKR